MVAKVVLIFCAHAVMAQVAFSQCLPAGFSAPCGLAGLNGFAGSGLVGFNGLAGSGLTGFNGYAGSGLAGCNGAGGVASTGGGLPVSSASPIAPVGVSVVSENVYEGSLAAGGNLPFLGTVAVEGVIPTAGAGAVSYGCGNTVGVASEGPIATGILSSEVFPPSSAAGFGGYGLGGISYGAGIGNGVGFGNFAGIGNGFGIGNGVGIGNFAGFGNGVGIGNIAGLGYGAGFGNGVNGVNGCGCGAVL